LVNFAGSSVFVARDPGFMALSLSLNEKDFAPAMAALLEETRKILSEPPTLEELEKARTNLASEQFYYLETVDGLARKYGHYQDLFGDPSYFERFMRQVNALKPEDILQVARKYFDPKTASLVIMTPAEHEKMEPAAQAWMQEFRKALKTRPEKKKKAPARGRAAKAAKAKAARKISWVLKKPAGVAEGIEKWTLRNGTTLIVRPSFDTPVVSLRGASLGGSRLEGAELQGATELLSRVWTAGVGPLDETQLNSRIDAMAASLSAFGGRNSQGLSMTCLQPFVGDMFELYGLALKEPRFEMTAVQREVKSMQEHVKLRKDNPAQLCILDFMHNMFKGHPYGHDPYGSEEHIGRLTAKSARAIYEQASGLTLVVSGAVVPREIKKWAERTLGDVSVGSGEAKLFPLEYPQKDARIFRESVKQQSHIVYGFPGLKLTDPDRYTLQVMQAILAGQGGRLFLELRDKASLAYSVAPMRMEGLEGGYFGAYIGCSPEKSGTAIQMMRAEFDKLMNAKVGAEELTRAQRYLIGKHDIELQKNSNITSAILFDHIYGIDFLETYHFSERIRAVNSEAIMRLAQKIFSRPSVITLVGPSAPW
jgi:zinc protease